MSVAGPHSLSLADILLREGVIDEKQYEQALDEHDRTSRSLVRIFTDMKVISDDVRIDILRRSCPVEFMKLKDVTPTNEVAGFMNREMCRKAHAVPIRIDDGGVMVAMEDPTDVRTISDIERIFGKSLKIVLASAEDIHEAIRRLPEKVIAGEAEAEQSPLARFFRSSMLALIVFVPLLASYYYVNVTPSGKEWFGGFELSKFEIILVYVVTWSSWAALGYFIHDLIFGRKQG